MSIEVVRLDDHRVYLIIGDPEQGYNIHRTDPDPVGPTYRHKYEARNAVLLDELDEDT